MQIGLKRFEEIKQDIKRISARNPHELMRAAEVSLFEIVRKWQQELHCLEKKAAGDCTTIEQISLKNNSDWFCHAHLKKMNTAIWSVSKANRALSGSD